VTRLHTDMTADCTCGLLMFPSAHLTEGVLYECANRHRAVLPLPGDERSRRLVQNWIDRRSAQIDVQHGRWGSDQRS
jgi:hypothetical protein